MTVAELFNGEIISADSWTVYKGFDIGTAKPTLQEQALIPHHLIDIADADHGFNAAEYKRLALQSIDDISKRGRLPIMAGGTGLYVDSIIYDYSFLPPATASIRNYLNGLSLDELQHKVIEKGINSQDIDTNNKRRLIRLFESNGKRPIKSSLRENTILLGIRLPEEKLLDRIRLRVDHMINSGLVEEVGVLAEKYGWDVEPMKGIGYREFVEYYNGTQTLEETRLRVVKSTLNLAKRQRTWFKRNNSIRWVNEQSEAIDILTTFLNN